MRGAVCDDVDIYPAIALIILRQLRQIVETLEINHEVAVWIRRLSPRAVIASCALHLHGRLTTFGSSLEGQWNGIIVKNNMICHESVLNTTRHVAAS